MPIMLLSHKILFVLCLLFSFSLFANTEKKAVPNEYVVFVNEEMERDFESQIHFLKRSGLEEVRELAPQFFLLKFPKERKLFKTFLFSKLMRSKKVLRSPNYYYKASLDSNDALMKSLWGIENIGQEIQGVIGRKKADVDLKKAWDLTVGSRKVVVAVIDTGVDYNHPDLKNNILINKKEKNGKPGVDDDGNGYVDDIYGYDFGDDDNDPMDDNGHGTHVAGVIGAEGNNQEGIVGVNWKVSLLPLRFLNKNGVGTLAQAVSAIQYAIDRKVHVINASWGASVQEKVLKMVIMRARDKNILFVAAAGNENANNDFRSTYPANYKLSNVISVASLNNKGRLSFFSNFGKNSVHIAAPGENILSTYLENKYVYLSGTSMAAPFVSGAIALLLAYKGGFIHHKEIVSRLFKSARQIGILKNRVFSHGMLSTYSLLLNRRSSPMAMLPKKTQTNKIDFLMEPLTKPPLKTSKGSSFIEKLFGTF